MVRDRTLETVTLPTAPRIVMLTAGYANSRRLADALHRSAIPFEIVTMSSPLPRFPKTKSVQSLAKYSVRLLERHVKSLRLLRQIALRREQPYPFEPTYAGYCNGKKLIRILKERNPDYIIMIGGGVLSAETIQCARIGVLNAHPGLLPWARGVDVIAASLLADVALGVTLHYIDEGIDTGPVIRRCLLPVGEERSLAELSRVGELLSAAMLHRAARQIMSGEPLIGTAQSERFRLYRDLPPDEKERAQNLAAQGRAKTLFQEWKTRDSSIEDGKSLLDEFLHGLRTRTTKNSSSLAGRLISA